MSPSRQVIVCGSFDNLRARDLRFLEEAARMGAVHVLLWSDEAVRARTGKPPRFPLAERRYFLEAVRYVTRVIPLSEPDPAGAITELTGGGPRVWVEVEGQVESSRRALCEQQGIEHCVLPAAQLEGFPEPAPMPGPPGRKRVVVTGCYDWLHSGHVRFFEEVSRYGDLYVIVGHDANIRLLKGEGHPLLCQAERRYAVGSIRHVKQALISTGEGWLDADPEIRRLKPDIYAVNEDGDKGGKREYCRSRGIEYLVLKRVPAPGLPPRSSTDLRGF
ncbi:MAG TPA: adenylyltransferase/cytidyltransferase family protein [Candidatus Paceibacterota bacterium]|jgi:cytidyltransferase-like protein|nr:adenylyltransferase/cytidyltransferase family protein [Candidatus Paceibacterota bacterium]